MEVVCSQAGEEGPRAESESCAPLKQGGGR